MVAGPVLFGEGLIMVPGFTGCTCEGNEKRKRAGLPHLAGSGPAGLITDTAPLFSFNRTAEFRDSPVKKHLLIVPHPHPVHKEGVDRIQYDASNHFEYILYGRRTRAGVFTVIDCIGPEAAETGFARLLHIHVAGIAEFIHGSEYDRYVPAVIVVGDKHPGRIIVNAAYRNITANVMGVEPGGILKLPGKTIKTGISNTVMNQVLCKLHGLVFVQIFFVEPLPVKV